MKDINFPGIIRELANPLRENRILSAFQLKIFTVPDKYMIT
jgi:hypothetical protein